MQLSIRTAAYFIDFNKKRDQSLHLEPFTEPTPHDFEETLTFLRAKYYDRKCFKMTLKTISKILRSNISQTIVAASKISGGVLFNSDVLARCRLADIRRSRVLNWERTFRLGENGALFEGWRWRSKRWRLPICPLCQVAYCCFFCCWWWFGSKLGVSPLCPLSLSVYKGYILALIGSDEWRKRYKIESSF